MCSMATSAVSACRPNSRLHSALIGYAARLAAETTFSSADLRQERLSLVIHAGGGLLVLLVPMVLSVYKPQGRTRYGRRKQRVLAQP